MKVTFLGTGDFLPRQSGHTSAFAEFNGTNLFIDFPATNYNALLQLGKDLDFVKNVFITHMHEDHVNGIQQLAEYRMIYNKMHGTTDRINLFIRFEISQHLWESIKYGLYHTNSGKKQFIDYFKVHIIFEDHFEIEGQRFDINKTNHVDDMRTFGISAKPYFHYSGDTGFDKSFLEEVAPQVKTIFHDCHLWDFDIKGHTSLEELKVLDDSIKEKLVLMHYHYGYDSNSMKLGLEANEKIKIARPLTTY